MIRGKLLRRRDPPDNVLFVDCAGATHPARSHSMQVVKPARLRKGEVIGLIAPAGPVLPTEKIDRSVVYLEGLGYRVKTGKFVASVHGHLAGDDSQRSADLNDMLRDPQVRAIFCLRGGYGTPRLLPFLDYTAAGADPKIVVGYSDITALQLALFQKTGLVTFSGPMPGVELWKDPDPFTEQNFWKLLTEPEPEFKLENPDADPIVWHDGEPVEGILAGGNLALLISSLGTPYCPSFRGAILFVEEVGEAPYRVDRLFTQLRNAGVLAEVNGLVTGKFTECEPADPSKPHLTLAQVLETARSWTRGAAISNLCYGHIPRKLTLPMGVRARVDPKEKCFKLLEPAVS